MKLGGECGRLHRDGHRRRRGAWGRPPRGLGRPHREGHRRRRGARGRPRGGVLNIIEDKLLKYKEETEMREIPKNQSLTCGLPCILCFCTKNLK